jgi:hypothetical protein
VFLFSPIRSTWPTHLILLDLICTELHRNLYSICRYSWRYMYTYLTYTCILLRYKIQDTKEATSVCYFNSRLCLHMQVSKLLGAPVVVEPMDVQSQGYTWTLAL